MAREHSFSFPLPNGLHARPASQLEEIARAFRADIELVNEQNGRRASAKNVLALVATDTNHGDACRLIVGGDDAAAAFTALTAYLAGAFLHCDDALPVAANAAVTPLSRSLRDAGLGEHFRGTVACRGLGWGRVVTVAGLMVPPELLAEPSRGAVVEQARFDRAVVVLLDQLGHTQRTASGAEAGLLKAHLGMLRDASFAAQVTERIKAGAAAGPAIVAAVSAVGEGFRHARNPLLRERVLDLEDIAGRLLEKLYGPAGAPRLPALTEPSVIVAESLTPGQLLALDRRQVQALVLGRAGQTSHTVILARSFALPTLTGVGEAAAKLRSGTEVVVDAEVGLVVPSPADKVRRYYERERTKLARLAARNSTQSRRPAVTADGRRLEVGANIASAVEATAAFAQGAEGIGIFRTELFFTGSATPPTEDEQCAAYTAAVRAGDGRPVVFRTLDIGGDKPVPFLPLPAEENPFLGCRGVRLYAAHAALLKTQMRAILRAAAHGPAKIMIPMIANLEEVRLAKRLLAEARTEVPAGTPVGDVAFGIMIEVPAAAFAIDELAAEVEFFSLGTNDLAQYFFAADRGDAAVASRYSVFAPAFLRLLKQIVSAVHARGRWIGLCGEMAEDVRALPLLVGLGLDEISLVGPRIAEIKAALATLNAAECAELLEAAVRCTDTTEVHDLIAARRRPAVPLLAPELITFDVDARSKAEAIRALVDLLHLAGRTESPAVVEEAVWRREDTGSTGFGEGFAVPHCKSDAIAAPTVAIARLRTPIDWQALDGRPVDVVVLLAIRASDPARDHLKTLARLSRLAMQDEFRALLRTESDPAALVATLKAHLEPVPQTVPA
jgi:multiphosphoryl transfer protein